MSTWTWMCVLHGWHSDPEQALFQLQSEQLTISDAERRTACLTQVRRQEGASRVPCACTASKLSHIVITGACKNKKVDLNLRIKLLELDLKENSLKKKYSGACDSGFCVSCWCYKEILLQIFNVILVKNPALYYCQHFFFRYTHLRGSLCSYILLPKEKALQSASFFPEYCCSKWLYMQIYFIINLYFIF